ncbi:MAG: gliding motility-associated C-terminal domain-containing protein [Flavobacteriales bacterium]
MRSWYQHIAFVIVLSFLGHTNSAQEPAFIENLGQWDQDIAFHLPTGSGGFWLEKGGWTISKLDPFAYAKAMHEMHDHGTTAIVVDGHAVKARFLNANDAVATKGQLKQTAYLNYFLGNDRSKWKGHVGRYNRVVYESLYDGVDLRVDLQNHQPKLTYIVDANSDPSNIKIQYKGAESITVIDNKLIIGTSVGDIQEQELIAFQKLDGNRLEVDCRFEVKENVVSFKLGKYDRSQTLYIDPTIIASTHSGCTTESWGHSATFNEAGQIYSAGRCFENGYPTTTGAFQMNFAGPYVYGAYQDYDICLSKYNQDGSSLIYATYLGGISQESPHSLIANSNDQIVILGSTNSNDFPVSSVAYDTTLNGGYDIVVVSLTSDGSQLVGSTYIGGSANDGKNLESGGVLTFYADDFRGEVVLDSMDNIYISSFTQSNNFPATSGVFQDTLAGQQDGVVCKLNPLLSTLHLATYLGGSAFDGSYALKLDDSLNIYVAGYTRSSNFPVSTTGAYNAYLGGTKDAFVVKINANMNTMLAGSFFGTNFRDQNYFIELDDDGGVYLYGTSDGGITATSGRYAGPALGGYIYKTNATLDTIEWISSFGSMAPASFLVDQCNRIYASGQGAAAGALSTASFDTVGSVLSLSQAGFYLMKLTPDATSLEFGTFYGNNSSHVDGGTSRFDKRGVIYQATCTQGQFSTVSWAYSTTNLSTIYGGYDNTAFKIDFASNVAKAEIGPADTVCAPIEIQFDNSGSLGDVHYWNFGDGTYSTDSMPLHSYDTAGIYEVFYAISDSLECYGSDTAFLSLNVLEPIYPEIQIGDSFCVDSVKLSVDTSQFIAFLWDNGQTTSEIYVYAGGTYSVLATANLFCLNADTVDVYFLPDYHFSLEDTGICELGFPVHAPPSAISYLWSTGDTTSSTIVSTTGEYSLTASNGFCESEASMNVWLSYVDFESSDTITCMESLELGVDESGGNVDWSTGETSAKIMVNESGTYWVKVSNGFCSISDTIRVSFDPQLVDLGPDQVVCDPTSIQANEGHERYLWSSGDTTIAISLDSTAKLWVKVWDGDCMDSDTIQIEVQQLVFKDPELIECDVDSAFIEAPYWNDVNYSWYNGDSNESIWVHNSGAYWVNMNTKYCSKVDTLHVHFVETPPFSLGSDTSICEGEILVLSPDTTYGGLIWSNGDTSNALVIKDSSIVWASQVYNECIRYDTLEVKMRQLWTDSFSLINNVMTPNGDGMNEELKFHVADEALFYGYNLKVYNRWGIKMFETDRIEDGWKGLDPSGDPVPEGTYFYIMESHTFCKQRDKIVVMDNVTLFR